MDDILDILENDARLTPEEISKMTGKSAQNVKKAISAYEKQGTILKYKTIINKEYSSGERPVRALIEVQITPQKNVGFDAIAERLYKFPQVSSCFLVSGSYDLLVVVEGKDMHGVAAFLGEKIASLEGVRGTVTHFLLKKYKEDGVILKKPSADKRISISY